jgi:hypothetical protein
LNLIADGAFAYLDTAYRVLSTTGAYITKSPDVNADWWVGPGVGGVVGVSGFPYQAGNILNLEWQTPPGLPGTDPLADGAETILEYHAIGQVPATAGRTLTLSFQALVAEGQSIVLVPIIWQNYRDGTYWIEEGEPVTIRGYNANPGFLTVGQRFTLPSLGSRLTDSSSYVGIGLDYPAQPGGPAPFQLLLYGFDLEIV